MSEERKLTTADIANGGTAERTDSSEASSRREQSAAVATEDTQMPDDSRSTEPLFSASDADRYREQWTSVQGEFVDQPREAVEQADRLVADLMQSLAAQFSETRAGLESQWTDDDNVSTEDLRVAMTRYRSFFERLLSA
jgi:hypothetical protein